MEPTAISPMATFEEKMKQRIRESIGDLMPDEALAKIIERGVQEAFFTGAKETDRWGHVTEKDSWVTTFLRAELEKRVSECVGNWIKENRDRLDTMAKESLQNGIATAALQAFERLWQSPVEQLRESLSEKLSGLSRGY